MTENKNRFVRSGKIILRLLGLTGFALGLILLAVLCYLMVIGLPAGIVRQITARAQGAGLPVRIESIRLSPFRGWVCSQVRLYSTSADDLRPLVQTRRLYVRCRLVHWHDPARRGLGVRLYSKDLSVSLGQPWEAALPADHPFRSAEQFRAALTLRRDSLVIGQAEICWGGIQLHTAGTVEFAGGGARTALPAETRRKAAEFAQSMAKIEFKSAPQIDLHFDIHAAQPDATFLDGTFLAEGLSRNGKTYDRITAALSLRNRLLELTELRVAQPDGKRLTASGTLYLDTQTAQLAVDNTLPAEDLLGLLPDRIRADLAAWHVTSFGALDFQLTCGPAPREQLLEKVQGEVHDARLRRNGLTLDPLAFRLARDGSSLEVSEIRTAANGGPLDGSFRLDTASGAWDATVHSRCDLAPFRSLAGEALAEFIGRFAFTNSAPELQLTLSQAERGAPFLLTGYLAADRFTCAGIPLEHLETSMVYSNHTLNLNPLRISEAEQQFTGNVQVDFAHDLGTFDAVSSFDPRSIARVLAPAWPTVLEKFRFEGPVYAEGRGRVDYGAGTNQAFSVTLHAEQAGSGLLQADLFDTRIEGRGSQLIFTNTTFRLCDGSGQGSAEFDLIGRDGAAPYRINAALTQIDFAKLLLQTGTSSDRTRGQLSATVHFTADAKAGFWNSVQGGGAVEIEKGQLASLPLFGGFSRLIQTSFPMFSLFSISSFFADYELRDGAVRSDDVELGGTLFSAHARGNYSPGGGLDFVLQASPLRPPGEDKKWYQIDRQATEAVRWVTSPFFKFFEFKLTGNLKNPEWRFINLPKEVSELLQRSGPSPGNEN